MEIDDILEMDLELSYLENEIKRHSGLKKTSNSSGNKSKMECKLKRCIHFIRRTGKLPSRSSEDIKEKEYFNVLTNIKKEGNQYTAFPELRKELLGLIKKYSHGKIKHRGDDTKLREIRNFLKTNKRWPISKRTNPEERELYQILYNYYTGLQGKTIKEKHPKIWNETMRLAKELKSRL